MPCVTGLFLQKCHHDVEDERIVELVKARDEGLLEATVRLTRSRTRLMPLPPGPACMCGGRFVPGA